MGTGRVFFRHPGHDPFKVADDTLDVVAVLLKIADRQHQVAIHSLTTVRGVEDAQMSSAVVAGVPLS